MSEKIYSEQWTQDDDARLYCLCLYKTRLCVQLTVISRLGAKFKFELVFCQLVWLFQEGSDKSIAWSLKYWLCAEDQLAMYVRTYKLYVPAQWIKFIAVVAQHNASLKPQAGIFGQWPLLNGSRSTTQLLRAPMVSRHVTEAETMPLKPTLVDMSKRHMAQVHTYVMTTWWYVINCRNLYSSIRLRSACIGGILIKGLVIASATLHM